MFCSETIVELDYIAQLRVDRAVHQQYLIASGQIPMGVAPQQQQVQQQGLPMGMVPYGVIPAGGYAANTVVPTAGASTGQYAAVPQYAPVGGFATNSVVPVATAEYIQPVGGKINSQ